MSPMRRMACCLVLMIAAGCRDSSTGPAPASGVDTTRQQDSSSTAPYFPVYDFLKSEIRYVDSLPVGIMQYRWQGKAKADSGYIPLAAFDQLAAMFVPDELKAPNFAAGFTETSFYDKSNNTATFLYTPRTGRQSVNRVDVLTGKGESYDVVRSIYMEKEEAAGDSVVQRKMYWKPGRYFQVTSSITRPNGDPVNRWIKVVWDNRD